MTMTFTYDAMSTKTMHTVTSSAGYITPPSSPESVNVTVNHNGTPRPSPTSRVSCATRGCTSSSLISDYASITLRCDVPMCMAHVTVNDIVEAGSSKIPTGPIVLIFYDLEITSSGEIEQIAAVSPTGKHINLYIKTSCRRNNSPLIRTLSPMAYMYGACSLSAALEHFIVWVNMITIAQKRSSSSPPILMIIAHNGMNHDHYFLTKAMLRLQMPIPNWLLSDTMPMFKTIITRSNSAKLADLVVTYAGWVDHVPHDALSDADALMNVTMVGDTNWLSICNALSTSYERYKEITGLSMFKPTSYGAVTQVSKSIMM